MARQGQVYINKGVADFARDYGMTTRAVSLALSKGRSFEEIAERVRMQGRPIGQALKKQTGKGADQAGDQTDGGSGYVSAREMRERKRQTGLTLDSRAKGETDKSARNGGSTGGNIPKNPRVVTSEDLEDGVPRDPETGETIPQARLRHEIAKANERELIVATRREALTPTARVNQWFSGCIIRAHDRLDRVGPELGDRLAAITDPAECARLVNDEIQEALSMLALFATGGVNGNGVNRATADTEDEEDSDSA